MTAAPEDRNHTRRGLPWLLGGIATSSLLAFIDLTLRSPGYLGHLWPRLRVTLLAVGAAVVLFSAVALRFKGSREPLGQKPRSVLAVLAATTVAALSAVAIRSALSTGAPDAVDRGVPLQWFSWYQGWPMVIFALAAVAFAAHHMIRTAGHRALPLMTTLIGVGTAYMARPQISPDQLWAMRRFLPVVLPLMFVSLAWAAGHVWAAIKMPARAVALALFAGLPLTTGFVIMAKTTASTATIRMQAGMIEQIESVCDVLPSDAVVMINGRSALVFSVPIRTYCDVGVMRGASQSRHDLVVAAGRSPVVIADGTSCLLGERLGLFAIRHTQPDRPTGRPPAGESPPRTEHFEVTALNGAATREERGTTPLLELETTLEITTHPETSVSLDHTANAAGRITVYLSPSGHVTAVLDSDQYGAASIRLGTAPADGLTRVFGAYLADGRLHATCGGVTIGSTTVGI